jgi:hypothetical protein
MNNNQYNDVFSNSDGSELEKMARERLKKQKIYNEAKNNRKRFESDVVRGISAYNSNDFSPVETIFKDVKTYNSNSDFVSSLPSVLENTETNISETTDNNSCFTNTIIESDLSSGYSSLPKKTKKHLRMSSNHLKKYSDNDDEKILNHIKKCSECRTQFMSLLKQNDNHVMPIVQQPIIHQPIINQQEDNSDKILGLKYKELRDVIIWIIIGVLIIFFLDVFLRK